MAETVKHTPGPWSVTGVSMNTGNVSVGMKEHRIVIAEVTNAASLGDMIMGAMKRGGGGFDQGDCYTQFANARLIAASPDLLEALRPFAEVYKHDIGVDEADADVFQAINHNRAPKLTVGDFRRAYQELMIAEGRS